MSAPFVSNMLQAVGTIVNDGMQAWQTTWRGGW
jgi:hypothetical protein